MTDVTIQVDASTSGPPINPLVLGSNVEWVDSGDNLLNWDTVTLDPNMVSQVQTMGPTILRYPGGDQSDLYNWRFGIGPLGSRGQNLTAGANQQLQTTYMGTGELLQLSQTLGASTIITVNVLTGTPADAAAWVTQTNVTGLQGPSGQTLPKVTYWEIGNEPYYPNPNGSNNTTCEIDPVTYVGLVNSFAAAMRAADPTIKLGIALSSDYYNGVPAVSVPCRGFARTVITGLTQQIDFVSLHDAYLPYDITGTDHPAVDEYYAAMGATQSVQADFAAMRSILQQNADTASLPFAITEYNALFNAHSNSAFANSMASPMGGLFVADALRFFASRDDVLMANTWSLSSNGYWGAIHGPTGTSGPYPRPDALVFGLFSEAMQGVRMTANVQSPSFNAPSLGFSSAAANLPLVTTLATMSATGGTGQTLRIIMINKDYSNTHIAGVSIAHANVTAAHLSLLTAVGGNVLNTTDQPGVMQRSESDLTISATIPVSLPASSVGLLTLELGSPATANPRLPKPNRH